MIHSDKFEYGEPWRGAGFFLMCRECLDSENGPIVKMHQGLGLDALVSRAEAHWAQVHASGVAIDLSGIFPKDMFDDPQ